MAKVNALMMDTVTKATFDRLSSRSSGGTTRSPSSPMRSPPGAPPTGGIGARPAGGGRTSVDYRALIEPVCHAIADAHDLWRLQAFFRAVVINGPIASGGILEGPALEPLVRTQLQARVGQTGTHPPLTAVAGALGEAWSRFQASVSLPGLPWYPSFAAVPAPQAPPTPNVPTPLGACTCDMGAFASRSLSTAMKRRLPNATADVEAYFEALAEGFHTAAEAWVVGQPVSNVMGKGPVPSFAPPNVPVGPVVGGDIVEAPGHLLT